ncbi:aminotransferase class V-fold PLP-dependent enzyme [Sedimenticola sp.]|uniref:aminotransferase class V-fold PLP-dependent enzyme n=1 Tax=Sedimenticola sp. TaxID=1940285 RepID=UPI003D0CF59C
MLANHFRKQFFPLMESNIYFASCSLGARSTALDQSMAALLDDMSSGAMAWSRFEEQVHIAKSLFAEIIGAGVDRIALLPNASIGAYQVGSTLNWGCQNRIVFSNDEFPSIAHVWHAQRGRGAKSIAVNSGGGWKETADNYSQYIDEKTKLVSIPYTGYLDGNLFPVRQVTSLARQVGAKVFIDAYQAVGIEPISVQALDCDYLVAGTMKYLLGLPGLAFLYVKEGIVNDIDPQLTGWFGRKQPFAFDPHLVDFPVGASRFETGTPAIPAVYAANAGMQLITNLDMKCVKQHIEGLVEYVVCKLKEQEEVIFRLPDNGRHGGVISIVDTAPALMADYMWKHKIIVSPRGGVVRLSFHYFNDFSEIDEFCVLLKKYRER